MKAQRTERVTQNTREIPGLEEAASGGGDVSMQRDLPGWDTSNGHAELALYVWIIPLPLKSAY